MNMPENASPDKPILKIESVHKSFGGVRALQDISFELTGGTILGLIGPNGAGKTTLFNVITGACIPDQGEVLFKGVRIRGKKMHDIVRMGIGRTFQNVELFESMTALENVMVGCHVRTRSGFWGAVTRLPWVNREEKQICGQARDLLSFMGLEAHMDRLSADLPFGWQRLVEIGRALASNPAVILLDEPAAGLNAVETRDLGKLILKIREQGITVILVEHDMSLTMKVCDRIVVLDQGRMLAQGTPREIQSNEAVMTAYLGMNKGE
jgi:branched-chain amino acid transport system ATP-binding protein